MPHLLIFGLGFTAEALVNRLSVEDWEISATSRTKDGAARIASRGYRGLRYSTDHSADTELLAALGTATHIVVSAPPNAEGDPVLPLLKSELEGRVRPTWIGYLSTIGVYGDHNGNWVDESTPATPSSPRSKRRLAAEQSWQMFARQAGAKLQIFRLAGIYGPGRSAIDRVRSGKARAILKPGQVFNRIHVDDAATALLAGLHGRGEHQVYNLADDLPAPPQDVLDHAAQLLGTAPPPRIAFKDAGLSDMARSFYLENKRVRNHRIKTDFGMDLAYPTYRDGLSAILASTKARA